MKENSIESMIQLQSLRGCLTVIAYRRWNFRTLVVSRASIKQEKPGLETYIQFPKEIENGVGFWKSSESRDNLEKRIDGKRKW